MGTSAPARFVGSPHWLASGGECVIRENSKGHRKSPPAWKWKQEPPPWRQPDAPDVYLRGRLLVMSDFAVMEFRGEERPQFMLSISASGAGGRRRATDAEVTQALRDFGMDGAEEDNHQPGIIRMFFLLADPRPGEEGIQCDCKEDEQVVVEPDGFRWSRTKDFDEARWPDFLRGRAMGTLR